MWAIGECSVRMILPKVWGMGHGRAGRVFPIHGVQPRPPIMHGMSAEHSAERDFPTTLPPSYQPPTIPLSLLAIFVAALPLLNTHVLLPLSSGCRWLQLQIRAPSPPSPTPSPVFEGITHLLHRRLSGEGGLDDGELVHAHAARLGLARVLGGARQRQRLGAVEGACRPELAGRTAVGPLEDGLLGRGGLSLGCGCMR